MNILNLLQEHFLTINFLGVAPFLPYLILTPRLMAEFGIFQFVEQVVSFAPFEVIYDRSCCKRFEFLHSFAKFGRRCNQVKVMFHDDIRKECHAAFFLDEAQRFKNDRYYLQTGK